MSRSSPRLAMATPAELEDALRRLDETRGREESRRDDVRRRLDELVGAFPSLKSFGRGSDASAG